MNIFTKSALNAKLRLTIIWRPPLNIITSTALGFRAKYVEFNKNKTKSLEFEE